MSEFLTELAYFVASYVGLAVAMFIFLNWQTKGFLGAYMRVKTSRGKKTLAILHSRTDTYYRAGFFDDKAFKYKGRDKKSRTIVDPDSKAVYSQLGVWCFEYDEVANKTINRLKTEASEQDSVTIDNLIREASEAPRLGDKKEKIILFVLVGVVIGILVLYYQQSTIIDTLATIQQVSGLIQ